MEGLAVGVVGATLAFWFAGLYQDWLSGPHALLIGVLVALAAPVGDLFESLIKRDLEVKDTGRLFGPHGGVLDRLDAVFFSGPRGVLRGDRRWATAADCALPRLIRVRRIS